MFVAVTGAAGFLGRGLVAALAGDPSIDGVVGIDLRRPAELPAGIEFRAVDLLGPDVEHALRGCDAVAHLAFLEPRSAAAERPAVHANLRMTANVAEAAARAGLRQLVHASSVAAYGFWPDRAGAVLDEAASCRGNADFYYAETKARCDRWLRRFAELHRELAVTILRPSVVLGGGSQRHVGWLRLGSRYPIVVDSARARRELGWRPRYPTTAEVLRGLVVEDP